MTLDEFTDIFVPLAIQLRNLDADEATIRAYYQALYDLEPEFARMAAERFAGTKREEGYWFPTAPEWRDVATACERSRKDELISRLRKLATPLCGLCDDTWWTRDAETNSVTPCACRVLRRLEILGRMPMPASPESERPSDPSQFEQVRAKALPAVKSMPRVSRAAITGEFIRKEQE